MPLTAALCLLLAAGAARAAPDPPPPAASSATTANTAASTTTPTPGATAAATADAAEPPPSMTAQQVIELLDQTVDWYRSLSNLQQVATEPSDLLVLYENRQTADQVVSLAFDIARTNAAALAKPATAAPSGADASAQTLTQLQSKWETQRQATLAALDDTRSQLTTARGAEKSQLTAKLSELQGELDLFNARKNLLDTMAEFSSGAGSSGLSRSALKSQIDAMALALPAASKGAASGSASTSSSAAATTPAAATPLATAPSAHSPNPVAGAASRFGIWDLAADVIRLWSKASTLKTSDSRTLALQTALAGYRTPLVERMKALLARGDTLASQTDTLSSAALNGMRDQFDALSAQFKQTAPLLIPLGKEDVLLRQFRRNLASWQEGVRYQTREALQTLAVRLGVLLVILAGVYVAAELWRRAVFSYIKDARRRYQLLLMRKIVLWALVVVIVGMAFASELGSVATFAGLITAGVAVAMQSVLVSIVGYFFLIGKYGIRIGDRVQIGDVAGEVIDVGLVRLYLMELGAHGLQGPTGRVVAFPNAVVFQATGGLFKQIPGVSIAWHELNLALPAGADFPQLKERLQAAAVHALADFSGEIDRQRLEIQRTTASASVEAEAKPQVQLRFSAAGVEALVRYPVHLLHAAEIDERMSRETMSVISATPGPERAA
jgi:small-conductance mechanosensitive channel